MNLSVKQKQRHERREQECGCQGTGVGEGGLGVRDHQVQNITHGMGEQQVQRIAEGAIFNILR